MSEARLVALAAALLLTPCSVPAQENLVHIGYAYPAGGRQGTTFQVTLGGRFLNDIHRVYFSGAGVEAKVLDKIKPLTENQVREMRQKLTDLSKGKPDAAARRQIAEINRTLARRNAAELRRQTHPAIGESVALEVRIRADAEPGEREMRVETARGASNPLRFYVGRLPEFREREPELDLEPQPWNSPVRFPPTVTTDITLPAVVNGQIVPRELEVIRYDVDRFTPGDADRYRFHARKGQRLVIAAAARELIPYLADAVPGWFQATLTLYDAKGKELAYDDDYRFHPDPLLFFTVPADGQYVVEIKDAIRRGRPDFVYRITIGEIPFITSIFPLGGRAGERTTVALTGWNLPAGRLSMDAKDKAPGVYPLSVRKGDIASNTVPFAVDTLPECLEKEPNDSPETAQRVTLPVIVNGRVDRPGDWDVFRFQGHAGQQVVAEVLARRLDSPLDSVLELTDAAGKRLAFNDDYEDKADGLHTHHADSFIQFILPAEGTYFVRLGDAQHKGGPEYAYRLRISAPRPDFELRVVPSCINCVSWRFTPIMVYALRRDGFSGAIALKLKDAPEGLSMGGGVVPVGQDRVRVTLAVPPWLPAEPVRLCLEGRAAIGGKEVLRTAVAADDMMQAFAYRHLVPAKDLTLVLGGRPRLAGTRKISPWERRHFQGPMTLLSEPPVRIPTGGTAEVRVQMPGAGARGDVQIELSDPPEGITVDMVSRIERGVAVVLRSDAAKAKPGLAGNLIANAFQNRTDTTKDGKIRAYRALLGPLPALPFEVVKP
ncbi:MAG: PPC domain-containing protein [Thermoguttaceae bacterium]